MCITAYCISYSLYVLPLSNNYEEIQYTAVIINYRCHEIFMNSLGEMLFAFLLSSVEQ